METIPAKHILTRNKSTDWFGTDHTMNLYRGCSHGCIYCDSRSECYRDDTFDTVKVKEKALELLAAAGEPDAVCVGCVSKDSGGVTLDNA